MNREISPKQLEQELKKHIVGQPEFVKELATIGFLHLARFSHNNLTKREVLLVMGESGSGKTYGVRTLAEILKLPFLSCNATEITRSGYVGETLADMMIPYKGHKQFDRMVVFIDEFDKISSSLDSSRSDNWNASVQHSILTALEGGITRTEGRSTRSSEEVDTRKMLFILGGAFTDILHARKEETTQQRIFKSTKDKELVSDIQRRQEIMEYGVIKEILGRITSIVELNPLSDDMLIEIAKHPNGLLAEYNKLLESYDIGNIKLSNEELLELVKQARKLGTNGRAVDSFVFSKVKDLIFEHVGYNND